MEQLQHTIGTISVLINETLPDAFGAPGVPGDADYIVYVANRLIDVYRSIIDWSLDFSTIATQEDLHGLVTSFSKMCEVTLCDIERFSDECCDELLSIPDNLTENSEPILINITLSLTSPETDDFYREVNILARKYGLPLLSDQ